MHVCLLDKLKPVGYSDIHFKKKLQQINAVL